MLAVPDGCKGSDFLFKTQELWKKTDLWGFDHAVFEQREVIGFGTIYNSAPKQQDLI